MAFVQHPLIRPETVEERAYQVNLAKKSLTGNTLLVLPTGLGKTAIAALVAAEVLKTGGKVLVLAPTKPLVLQHNSTFQAMLNIPGERFALFTGTTASGQRRHMWDNASVISATPQTIQRELEKGRIGLEDVGLLVVDESHHTVSRYSYVEVARRYLESARKPLILGLTASPSSDKVAEIRENLAIRNVEVRTEADADVAPYVQRKDVERVFVTLPAEFEEIQQLLKSYSQEIFEKIRAMDIHITPRKVDIIRLQQSAIKNKIYPVILYTTALLKASHATEMLETQGIPQLHKYLETLAGDKRRTAAMMLKNGRIQKARLLAAKLCEEGREHPKIEELKRVVAEELGRKPGSRVIIFSHFRDSAQKITSALAGVAKPVRFVGQATKGEDVGLNQAEQADIIRRFREGDYNVLVCTRVGEEGLDIPSVDLVVFYEPVPSDIRKIQREGRTGRARAGKVIVLVTRRTRDESNYYTARNKERKMRQTLESMKPKLGQRMLGEW
jgi:Fanconi anemia group M protein